MRRFLLTCALCLIPVAAPAQEDSATARDRSFLTGLIEDNLSGAGRSVRLDGFAGALSSRATFDQLTIADKDGVWITIRDGAISWNRSALLSGRIEINEMSAAEIDLPRRPLAEDTPSQATGFSLPDLPVAVNIGKLAVDKVVLGEPIMGVAADVRLQGQMQLSGGEGSTDISVTRIDGKQGTLSLKGSYSNATRDATLDLLAKEGADGIAVQLLNIPGRPSAEVAIHGSGVIDQFRTEISIRTDGQQRVAGFVQLGTKPDPSGEVARTFVADISGDITPLFMPEYQEFFGNDIKLQAAGQRLPSGQTDLSKLILDSRGVDLEGELSLRPSGMPLQASLTLRAGLEDGSDVLLPVPGEKTLVRSADLKLRYDGRVDNGWTLDGMMLGLKRPSMSMDRLTLDGSGRINAGSGDAGATIGGTLRFAAAGLDQADLALQQAVGSRVSGRTIFSWQSGGKLRLPVLMVAGDGYEAGGRLEVDGLDSGVELTADLTASVQDLSRLSGLAGRPVGGAGEVKVDGSYAVLSGVADARIEVAGQDLAASVPEVDNLLRGASHLTASIRRDENGITIRSADLSASTLSASAAGTLSAAASDLAATLNFSDLSAMGGRYKGAMSAKAAMTGPAEARAITLTATGDGLGVGQSYVDRLIRGRSDLSVAIVQTPGMIRLARLDLKNGEVTLNATGKPAGDGQNIALSSRLRDLALLVPGFPGPVTLDGTVDQGADGYRLDIRASGPGNTDATVTGTAAADFSDTDLAIKGAAESAIINPFIAPRNIEGPLRFDLRMNGAPGLSALSGQVALENGRVVAPNFNVQLSGVAVSAALNGQTATLSGSAAVNGGGEIRVSGPVGLQAPFNGDLSIGLNAVHLRDAELYDTDVSGDLRINGPLTGGAIISGGLTLGTTELRVPSTGFGNATLLESVKHVGEPAAVQTTRQRAGLIQSGGAEKTPVRPFGLDVTISAPARIFVRGRGLDAELGGALAVGGTTTNVVPTGQFNLIRGRLDMLGKRFTIDEGLIQLQGALTPYIRFSATTQSEGIQATILIDGDATAPDISFLSAPELPQEEVISRLLFSKSLSNLSAFQAAQLASAVATLAGKGGEGIVSKLRQSFGLDDLDLASDEAGNTSVRVGKYISEKVYTNVAVGSDGKTELSINLDVRPGLTVRGTAASDNSSGVGIYFEKDY